MPGEIEANPTHGPNSRGFTLIELLVVIGLITVILGVLSFSLEGGGTAVGLRNGQAMISSLVSAARAKAALTGSYSRLVVAGDESSSDSYLRCLAVATQNEMGNWVTSSSLVYLPKNIRVVPSGVVPVVEGLTWEYSGKSKFSSDDKAEVSFEGLLIDCWYIAFSPRGSIPPPKGIQLVLSTVLEGTNGAEFNSPQNINGVKVSEYGIQTLISDGGGFSSE